MQMLTEKIFRLSPPGGIFDETAVRNLFPERTGGARKLLVHRAVAEGEIIRLKPGLFLLAPEFRRTHPHPFVLTAALHSPSYVSLESGTALEPGIVAVIQAFGDRINFHPPLAFSGDRGRGG